MSILRIEKVIECSDGYFYGRVINDEIRSIRKVESFYSPSVEELYHQIALKNNDFEDFPISIIDCEVIINDSKR